MVVYRVPHIVCDNVRSSENGGSRRYTPPEVEPEIHHFVIPAEYDGKRLDQVLVFLLPGRSRNQLVRLIEEGRVAIFGRICDRKSSTLSAGDEVEVSIPPPSAAGLPPQDIPLTLLFEDEDLAVIDKPPGLVMHPAAGHADGTLVNALLYRLGDLSGVGGELRPGIVHRLDKDTSGVVIIAKNDAAHRALTAVWNGDQVTKSYLALVYGAPVPSRGSIEGSIGRDPRDRKRMAVVSTGRRAHTEYETIEAMRYLALLRCTLKTGRTHQIRVHLKSLGHPIVGDPAYSGPQWRGIPDKKIQKAIASFPRQALHARRLSFPHPRTGAAMTVSAPLPEDFRALLAAIGSRIDPEAS